MRKIAAFLVLVAISTLTVTACSKKNGPTRPRLEFGSLAVISQPSDARIWLDGADTKSVTPDTLYSLTVGDHALRLVLQGYPNWLGTVTVVANQLTLVNACLEPTFGYIVATSDPSGATIVLDGTDTGLLTPDTLTVAVGSHAVLLKKQGYSDYERTVTVSANQAVAVHGVLPLLCPGGIVGDPSQPPTIQIIGLNPGDTVVRGVANNVDARRKFVAGWALTNQWYEQPLIAYPLTTICGDGSWSFSTNPWDRVVVLLVDSTYVPTPTKSYHPALTSKGVLAWDQYPPARPDLPLPFSGYQWILKVTGDRDNTYRIGPGPNFWSDSPDNVFVDAQDRLHMKITYRNGKWYCPELLLPNSLGYGEYIVKVDSRVDAPDRYVVIAPLFTYESATRELDIEFAGDALIPGAEDGQFVVQPYTRTGNLKRFTMPPVGQSSHRILWCPDRVEFLSWKGHGPYPPSLEDIIFSWTYTGLDNPPPGNERIHLNAWLFGGIAPENGQEVEVVITSFSFRP